MVWIKCFDDGYTLQGDAQSAPLTKDSALDTWGLQWVTVTCGPNATKVQAVLSVNTPDEDLDGDGSVDGGQLTGNAYFDDVVFGEYVP